MWSPRGENATSLKNNKEIKKTLCKPLLWEEKTTRKQQQKNRYSKVKYSDNAVNNIMNFFIDSCKLHHGTMLVINFFLLELGPEHQSTKRPLKPRPWGVWVNILIFHFFWSSATRKQNFFHSFLFLPMRIKGFYRSNTWLFPRLKLSEHMQMAQLDPSSRNTACYKWQSAAHDP